MANLHPLEIILEFEPIIKLVCENVDCQFNLINAANNPDKRMAACNLKQILINSKGCCHNFKPLKEKE